MAYIEEKYFETEIEEALDKLEGDRLIERYSKMIPKDQPKVKISFFNKYWKIIAATLLVLMALVFVKLQIASSNELENKTNEIIAGLTVYENPEWSMRSGDSSLSNFYNIFQSNISQENYSEALSVVERMNDLEKDEHIDLSMAQIYLKQSQPIKSLLLCEKLILNSSKHIQIAEFTKSLALIHANQNKEANVLIEKIISTKGYKWKSLEQLKNLNIEQ